jgi:DNA-binding IclR family transcriptional regulator
LYAVKPPRNGSQANGASSARDGQPLPARVPTLSRVLGILLEVIDAPAPIRVTDVATNLGLHKATASRILSQLAAEGFVVMDRETHLYMPGTVVTSRLRTSGLERLIQNLATPIMTKLRDVSGETVALHFVSWPDRVVVAEVVSNRGLRLTHAPGQAFPLTTGATGAVYLAHLPDSEVAAAFEARPVAPDRAVWFERQLDGARRTGVAFPLGPEVITGMHGVAVAILSADARPVAMLSAAGPLERWTDEAMAAFAPTLQEAGMKLSRTLGYAGDGMPRRRVGRQK